MEITLWLCLMTLIVFAVFGAMVYILMRMNRSFTSLSRLEELAARYATHTRSGPFPGAPVWNGLRLGGRDWVRSVHIQVDAQGLYLDFRLPLRQLGVRPPLALIIPWKELHPQTETRFKSMPAKLLTIGDPPLTELIVFTEVYEQMVPYLT